MNCIVYPQLCIIKPSSKCQINIPSSPFFNFQQPPVNGSNLTIFLLNSTNYSYWFTNLSLGAPLNDCDLVLTIDISTPTDLEAARNHKQKSEYTPALIYQSLCEEICVELTISDLLLSASQL